MDIPSGKVFPRPPPPHMGSVNNNNNNNNNNVNIPNQNSLFPLPIPPNIQVPSPVIASNLIFEGHLLNNNNKNNNKLNVTETAVVNELFFKNKKYFIEGFHIVPNKIKVPGTSFEGMTIPDMAMRSFSLHIFARIFPSEAKEFFVQHLLSLTINGGIEWLAIPHPFDKLPIDYLSFDGDFEVLSIMIHGTVADQGIDRMEDHLPLPIYYNDISLENNDVEVEFVGRDVKPTLENKDIDDLTNKINSSSAKPSVFDHIKGLQLQKSSPLCKVDFKFSVRYSESLVPIQRVAELVEQLFSIEQHAIHNIDVLNKLLEECWKTDSSDLDRTACSAVQMAIGVEAATLMVEILIKQLQSLGSDNHFVTTVGVDSLSSEETTKLFHSFANDGMEILRYCRNLLVNEFTAREFSDAGGIEILISLLQQQPQLPMKLLEQLVFSLWDAALFPELAFKIIKSPKIDEEEHNDVPTAYQSILYIAAGLKSTSPLLGPTKCLVNWLSFVDSSFELKQLAQTILDDSVTIADAIGWRNSLNNSSSIVEDVSENNNNLEENENSLLHTTTELITNLYKKISTITNQFMLCVSSILSDELITTYKTSTEEMVRLNFNNSLYSSILDVLFSSRFIASLSSLISFAKLVTEFDCIIDWEGPSHDLPAYSRYINQSIISLIICLFNIPKFEVLLYSCSEDVELIRSFLQTKQSQVNVSLHYLTLSYSPDSMACKFKGIEYIDSNWETFIASSTWTMWLIVHVFTSLDAILEEFFSINNYEIGHSSDSVFRLLMSLLTLSNNSDISTLISRIISLYYINNFCRVLNLLYNHKIESNMNGVTEKVFNIFEIFINCADEIVLNNIYRKKDQILKLLTELKSNNSSNQFFNNENSIYRISQLIAIVNLEMQFTMDRPEEDNLANAIQKLESNLSLSVSQFSRFLIFFKVDDYTRSSLVLNKISNLVIKLCESGLKSNLTGNFGMEDSKALNTIENVLQYNNNILFNLFACLTFICRNSSLLFENYFLFSNKDEKKLLIDIVLYSHTFAKSILCNEFETVFANESMKIMSLCSNILLFVINNKSNKHFESCRKEVFSYLISQSIRKQQLLDSVLELLSNILPGGHYYTNGYIPTINNNGVLVEDTLIDIFGDIFSEDLNSCESNYDDNWSMTRTQLAGYLELKESPDILYRSFYDNIITLEMIVLKNFSSCSTSIQKNSRFLAEILFSSNKTEAIKLGSLISHYLERYLALSLQLFADDSDKNMILDESSLTICINILIFVDTVVANDIPCCILVRCGVLFHLFCAINSVVESISLLSLQCLTSIYKVLTKLSLKDDASPSNTDSTSVRLYEFLPILLYKLSFHIVEIIPSLLKRYKNNPNLNMLQQISILLQLIPSVNIKQFLTDLNSIGEGLTIEFLAVKLWIEFEESFQLMVETTDIFKLLSSNLKTEASQDLSKEDLTKLFCTYHVLFMRACVSLKAITDLTLKCYVENIITLSTLSKSMRTSLADPKKVMIRYQRLYTMWASGLPNIIGVESSYTNTPSCCDIYDNDLFESRQNIISLSLKGLVDNLSKFSKFYLLKEEKYNGGLNAQSFNIDEDLMKYNVDFKNPFIALDKNNNTNISEDILDVLFVKLSYYSRLSNEESVITNIIHNDLRRHLKPNPLCNVLKSDIIALTIPSVRRQIDIIEGRPSKRKYINYSIDSVSRVLPSPIINPIPTFSNPPFINKFNKHPPKPNYQLGGQIPMNIPPKIPPNHFQNFK